MPRIFEFDPVKSAKNERERGLPFDLAAVLFDSPMIEWADKRFDYGEVRINALGRIGPRIFFATYVMRGAVTRIISFRKASKDEQEVYHARFGDRR